MPVHLLSRLGLILILAYSLTLSGCSYIPWIGDKESEEDLAFEQEFGDPEPTDQGGEQAAGNEEDAFFAEDSAPQDSGFDDSGFDDAPAMDGGGFDDSSAGGFASVEQPAKAGELRSDVETLQAQQEALITRVRELQEIIQTMEPRLAATQSQLETKLGGVSADGQALEPDIQRLNAEVGRLNDEIARLKQAKGGTARKASVTPRKTRKHRGGGDIPLAYSKALAAYRAGDYDGSILQFQEFAQKRPPEHLKDNVLFWIGSSYFKLDMFDDAIAQFQSVIDNFPSGNKVHDSRYMLGVSLFKKGDRGRSLDVLEAALKSNPPMEVRDKIQKQLMEIK